jgi:hypothetical protein
MQERYGGQRIALEALPDNNLRGQEQSSCPPCIDQHDPENRLCHAKGSYSL